MAEIEVKGGKKSAPRVDLTPMVDLGFLLITFFMFTTTMSQPKSLEIKLPFDDPELKVEDKSEVKNDAAFTVILGKDHRIYYYTGMANKFPPPEVLETTFKDQGGIRQVLIDKVKQVQGLISNGTLAATDQLVVMIKPEKDCTASDVVKTLDEMTINGIKVYSLQDLTPDDDKLIAKFK